MRQTQELDIIFKRTKKNDCASWIKHVVGKIQVFELFHFLHTHNQSNQIEYYEFYTFFRMAISHQTKKSISLN
jgi:hypothetical protein